MKNDRFHPSRWLMAALLIGAIAASAPCFSKPLPKKPSASAIVELKVQPTSLILDNKRDARHVLVLGRTLAGDWVDLASKATYKPTTGAVRGDSGGYLQPLKKGADKVIISAGGKQVTLPVTVRSMDSPPISYVREVQPILSKAGCNAGTCHGSAKGKNGFKLSLRGYDPEFDHHSLIDDISGRRFNRVEPAQSLMLLKPTQGVPHQGGLIFERKSRYYNTIHQWIAEGAKFDGDKVKRPERLEVLPDSPILSLPGAKQPMLVIAHYPDGTTRDVTRDAVFTSNVTDVATVTSEGEVTAVRRGESAILVRYEGAYATNPLIVMGDRSGYKWVNVPESNYIDTLVHQKLERVKTLPAELCSDADFVRRVYLDLIGLPPTPEQTRAFLNTPPSSPPSQGGERGGVGKREQLIDQLLDSPEFVDHWTNKWADLLQCNRKFLGEKGVWMFRQWIRASVAVNKRYDQFVRELMTASGSTYGNPPSNYFRVSREPDAVTENATQLFLGVRFQCCKCHDHPFEKWTQNQYYQLGAFFAQVGIKRGELDGEEFVYEKPEGGEVKHPKTGAVVPPAVPAGYEILRPAQNDKVGHHGKASHSERGEESRRQEFARWLTSPENPFFARAMANRLWSYFMGRGIIDPVDDIRGSNPPSNPELLDALTSDFIKSGFDLKHLMRIICRSRVYQQSIKTNKWNEDDKINFSHAVPRRLTAEQLMDAITVATGSPQKFPNLPLGFRAAQLPDSQVLPGGFLDLFGRPARESPCECERTSEVSLGQALNLLNGPTIADAIIAPKGRVAQLIQANVDDRQLVEELYLAALCRLPREDECAKSLEHLRSSQSRTEGAQDLMWALINTPAFLFNR